MSEADLTPSSSGNELNDAANTIVGGLHFGYDFRAFAGDNVQDAAFYGSL